MPGTDIACNGIFLRACYAMSGTDVGYAATRRILRAIRALQDAPRLEFEVLSEGMVLPGMSSRELRAQAEAWIACGAMQSPGVCGSELAYADREHGTESAYGAMESA
eukprot:2003312-Rhodomonas_salina.1